MPRFFVDKRLVVCHFLCLCEKKNNFVSRITFQRSLQHHFEESVEHSREKSVERTHKKWRIESICKNDNKHVYYHFYIVQPTIQRMPLMIFNGINSCGPPEGVEKQLADAAQPQPS